MDPMIIQTSHYRAQMHYCGILENGLSYLFGYREPNLSVSFLRTVFPIWFSFRSEMMLSPSTWALNKITHQPESNSHCLLMNQLHDITSHLSYWWKLPVPEGTWEGCLSKVLENSNVKVKLFSSKENVIFNTRPYDELSGYVWIIAVKAKH